MVRGCEPSLRKGLRSDPSLKPLSSLFPTTGEKRYGSSHSHCSFPLRKADDRGKARSPKADEARKNPWHQGCPWDVTRWFSSRQVRPDPRPVRGSVRPFPSPNPREATQATNADLPFPRQACGHFPCAYDHEKPWKDNGTRKQVEDQTKRTVFFISSLLKAGILSS